MAVAKAVISVRNVASYVVSSVQPVALVLRLLMYALHPVLDVVHAANPICVVLTQSVQVPEASMSRQVSQASLVALQVVAEAMVSEVHPCMFVELYVLASSAAWQVDFAAAQAVWPETPVVEQMVWVWSVLQESALSKMRFAVTE
jgi:hypothetical protein